MKKIITLTYSLLLINLAMQPMLRRTPGKPKVPCVRMLSSQPSRPRPSTIKVINPDMRTTLTARIYEVIDRMFHPRHHRMLGMHPICTAPRATEYPWLPNYIIKTEDQPDSRITGSLTLENSIYKRNNHLLELPTQEAYVIPQELHRTFSYGVPKQIIVARKISGCHNKLINREQARQLKELLEDTEYNDCSSTNLVHTPEGTIGLIDTELRGFSNTPNNLDQCLLTLLRCNKFEPDAQEYIEQELSKLSRINKPNA